MEAQLAGLASTLVGLMVTDAWAQAKGRLARFFARDGDGARAARELEELEADRGELVAAREAEDHDAVADIEAGWRSRLRRELRADPRAAAELAELLAELRAESGAETGGSVTHNTISGGTQHGPVIQADRISGGVSFHAVSPPPLAGPPPSPSEPQERHAG
ncbi:MULTISPECIES: hypothetical protein [Streptomyces]|nr:MULTISPECIES: hypothetical protein [Streptomyces]